MQEFGFSSQIITQFFTPFFTGIFLENELTTSSRMFEFVFKMFGEGLAVLPKGGMEEISKQLVSNLKNTTFQYNTQVTSVSDKEIILHTEDKLVSAATIIATDASKLVKNAPSKKSYLEILSNTLFYRKQTCNRKTYNWQFLWKIDL